MHREMVKLNCRIGFVKFLYLLCIHVPPSRRESLVKNINCFPLSFLFPINMYFIVILFSLICCPFIWLLKCSKLEARLIVYCYLNVVLDKSVWKLSSYVFSNVCKTVHSQRWLINILKYLRILFFSLFFSKVPEEKRKQNCHFSCLNIFFKLSSLELVVSLLRM